jgi:hypothetical protein
LTRGGGRMKGKQAWPKQTHIRWKVKILKKCALRIAGAAPAGSWGLREKRRKQHVIACHHELAEQLCAYIDARLHLGDRYGKSGST